MSTAEYGTAPAPASPVPQFPIEKAASRGKRLAGLLIVLSVAILPFFVTSLLTVIGVKPDASDLYIRYRIINGLLMEATSLALLAYVVRQNRQTWADLGLVFRARDLVYGMLLWFVALCCYRLAFPSVLSFSELMGWHPAQAYVPALKVGECLVCVFG